MGVRTVSFLFAASIGVAKGDPAGTATCVFDALHLTTYLAQAGVAIDQSTRDCDPRNEATGWHGLQVMCAVDILNVIESFGFAGAFIASAVSSCAPAANKNAMCGSEIAGLIASIADMSQASAAIAHDCPQAHNPWVPPPVPPPPNTPPAYQSKQQRNYGAMTAFCVIAILQSMWFIARAGLNINAAVLGCAKGQPGQATCASAVSGVIAALSATASYIAGAASNCARGTLGGAGCSSDALKLIAGMGGVASNAAGMHLDCAGNTDVNNPRRLMNASEAMVMPAPPVLEAHEREHLHSINISEEEMSKNPLRVIQALKEQNKIMNLTGLPTEVRYAKAALDSIVV